MDRWPKATTGRWSSSGPTSTPPRARPCCSRATTGGAVHTLLRDQRTIAGVGRGYSDDALHEAGISPFATLASLDRPSPGAARRGPAQGHGRRARGRAKRKGGLPPKVGDHWVVHGRHGQPCPRCGADLRRVSPTSPTRSPTARPARPAARSWPTGGSPASFADLASGQALRRSPSRGRRCGRWSRRCRAGRWTPSGQSRRRCQAVAARALSPSTGGGRPGPSWGRRARSRSPSTVAGATASGRYQTTTKPCSSEWTRCPSVGTSARS